MFRASLLGVLAGLVGAGCATPEALEKYPYDQIDRPYTLPEGVATWETWTVGAIDVGSDGRTRGIIPVPIPLVWRHALFSDSVTLSWFGLPMQLQAQFLKTESQVLGASIDWPFAYSSLRGGFAFYPGASLWHRLRLAGAWALESEIGTRQNLGEFRAVDPSSYLETLVVNQLGHGFALSAGAGVRLISRTARDYNGVFGTWSDGTGSFFHADQWLFPVSARAAWRFANQWETTLQYSYVSVEDLYEKSFGISYREDQHAATLKLIHYW